MAIKKLRLNFNIKVEIQLITYIYCTLEYYFIYYKD